MFSTLSALLLISTLVSASPVPQQQPQKRNASVISFPPRNVVDGTVTKIFDPEAANRERARVHHKYRGKKFAKGSDDHHSARSAASDAAEFDVQKRSTKGHDSLINVSDSYWYGPLSVGTPAQATTVDFDTGSSDLWLPLSSCTNCPGPRFKNSASSTYKVSTTPFTIEYQDQSAATGKVATDKVTVAGLTVAKQGFGAVTKEKGNFLDSVSAGLLGLGFTPNAASGKTPFFINLVKQGSLASNVFSFYMSRSGKSGSELCIGCKNSAKYTGAISYFPLDASATGGTQYYWNIKSAGFSYNNGVPTGGFSAIIDSGTTLIYIPTAAAKLLYAQIPGAKDATSTAGAGFYTFPCKAKLAPINLTFGTTKFALNPLDFNLGALYSGSSDCVGGIIGEDDIGKGLAIIGDEFMKNWYSVFNYDTRKVGFAKAI